MKNKYILTALLASFFIVISFVPLYAQTSAYPTKSISGNDLCGATAQTECNVTNFKAMVSSLLSLFTVIGSVFVVLVLVVRMVMIVWARKDPSGAALKKVGYEAFQSLIGFVVVFAIAAGALTFILKSFGVQDFILKLFSEAFVTHAYADTGSLLPNPTTMNNLYDVLLSLARIIIRWFVYPSIVGMWLFSGFAYVYAQGKPEELKKAHSYTLLAAIITIAVVMVQGFVFAVRNTALQVIGSSTVTTPASTMPSASTVTAPVGSSTTSINPDGRVVPAAGTTNSVCTTQNGLSGQRGLDGSCVSRSDSYVAPLTVTPTASVPSSSSQADFVITPQSSGGSPTVVVTPATVNPATASTTPRSTVQQRCFDVVNNITRDGTPDANSACTN
ncbi:MAG: hypothetical protein WC444_01950 [Candidatus Paceibacterota bacterium]